MCIDSGYHVRNGYRERGRTGGAQEVRDQEAGEENNADQVLTSDSVWGGIMLLTKDFRTVYFRIAGEVNAKVEELRNTLNTWMEEDQHYDNPVERKPFQQKVWSFISKNIDAIVDDMGDMGNGDYPAASYAAWLLVQHMDGFPQWQKAFLQKLPSNHIKHQFLSDRVAVNDKIRQFASQGLYGCNDPRFNGDPVSGVRDTKLFNNLNPTSAQQALQQAIQQNNTCLVAAVRATGAQTQPSYSG